jgi:lantibiotic modifying enzyme
MKRWLWQPGGDGLARGRLGLAVLVSALFRVTGLEHGRREAMSLAGPALARAAQAGGVLGRPHQPWCGLETGLGGFLLATAILAETIGREAIPSGLVDAAIATVPPPDSRREIAGGIAGLRIGLLALGDVSHDPRLAGAAARCAFGFDGVEQTGAATRERFDSLPVLEVAASAVARERGGADRLVSAGLAGIDSFRFGTAGEVDALLWLTDTLGRADLAAAASRRAAAAIARAESSGWRWLPGIDEAVSIPGLFDGLAGFAYMLLRLADPAAVPSLSGLILEPSEVRA